MSTKINGGATIWARQTINSEIFLYKSDKWFKIWFYIVSRAHFQTNNKFNRGECFLKYDWIKEKTGATKDQIYSCIKWLKKEKMLTTRKTTRGMYVKVQNYDKYQKFNNYKNDTGNDIQDDNETIQKRYRDDTILNKDKKEKKEIKNDNFASKLAKSETSDKNTSEKNPEVLSENKQITEIFNIFRKENKAVEFQNKTQQKAISNLIQECGFKETERWANFALKIQGKDKYAPQITTPHQLWQKLIALKNYKKTNKETYEETTSKYNEYSGFSKTSY